MVRISHNHKRMTYYFKRQHIRFHTIVVKCGLIIFCVTGEVCCQIMILKCIQYN